MKFKILLFLSPFIFGTALPLFLGCSRVAPLLPPPPPTPTPQVLCANGTIGTWFTNALTANFGGCTTNAGVTAVTDPISGNGNALILTATGTCGFYYLAANADVNPTLYYSTGHLQFDVLLAQPPANITSMNVQYVNYLLTGNYAEYVFPNSLINSFSSSSFTHVSIPFASFTTGNGYAQTSIDTPFQISWNASSSNTSVILDNIQWTFN